MAVNVEIVSGDAEGLREFAGDIPLDKRCNRRAIDAGQTHRSLPTLNALQVFIDDPDAIVACARQGNGPYVGYIVVTDDSGTTHWGGTRGGCYCRWIGSVSAAQPQEVEIYRELGRFVLTAGPYPYLWGRVTSDNARATMMQIPEARLAADDPQVIYLTL